MDYLRIAREKARDGNLPWSRQIAEMLYFFIWRGLGPGYYLMARFWRREMPWAVKQQHWNGKRYLRFVHRVNDPRYYKVSQNKMVEKALLKAAGLVTAPWVGLFHSMKGYAADGQRLCDAADLVRTLQAWPEGTYFCKPAEGDSGRGVFAVRIEHPAGTSDGMLVRDPVSGAELDLADLVQRLSSASEGYVLEQAIVQHPHLAAFNASSVNTLRMWVVDDGDGGHVAGAFLRVGRAGSLVDNTAAGGLACAIDLDNGRIREALDLTPRRGQYVEHPDSGARLLGAEIPFWQDCMATACEALRILPGARFVGMDIAVTESGPCVVEYNVEPSQQGATHFDRPHGELFRAWKKP